MKNLTLTLLGVLATLYACKKQPEPIVYPDYGNLQPGNYWIYDVFTLDSNGVYTPYGITDSNYVEKDTLINGNTYYKLMLDNELSVPGHTPAFIRDSLHFLVNSKGKILFSSENFSDVLSSEYRIIDFTTPPDTLCLISAQMAEGDQSVQTPAGTFSTKNCVETYTMWPKYIYYSEKRYLNHRYAENIGLVEAYTGFFIADKEGKYLVQRLKKYGTN